DVRFDTFLPGHLARNSHQPTAVGVHLPHFAKAMWGRPESTALGSDKGLDVLYSTPARFVSLAPCISGHLRALASRPGEKCGLGTSQ
ncbi:MAG: hypothetical protein V3U06_06170, partial [Candidatus Binatia bacterium]